MLHDPDPYWEPNSIANSPLSSWQLRRDSMLNGERRHGARRIQIGNRMLL
jgi:hypothetical protein